jgi:hypothetical protein
MCVYNSVYKDALIVLILLFEKSEKNMQVNFTT